MSSAHITLCKPTSTLHVFQWEMEGCQSMVHSQSALPPLVFSFFFPPIASFQANNNPHEIVSVGSHCFFKFLVTFSLFPIINYIEFPFN